ncbi:MAG: PAS domain S-box protein [Nitrolancea sp.]
MNALTTAWLNQAIVITDANGVIQSWTDAAVNLFGFAADDAIGERFDLLVVSEKTSPENGSLDHLLSSSSRSSNTIELGRRDGSSFVAAVSSAPVSGTEGLPTGWVVIINDTTKLDRATSELRHVRDRYNSLIESLPAATYTVSLNDHSATASSMSPQIEAITGYSNECWNRDASFGLSIIHPDDVSRVANLFTDIAHTRDSFSIEYRYVRPDGTYVWVRNDAAFHEGDRPFWQGFIVDITKQKATEETLRRSESEFRSAFVDAATPMAIADQDGTIIRVNQQFCEMVGYSEQELLGTDITALTHPDDLDDSVHQRGNVVDGTVLAARYTRRYLHKDGTLVWGLVSLSAARLPGDPKVYVLGQIQDITEQKLAEEQIRRMSDRYQQLVDNANDVIVSYDVQGRFNFVNRRFVELSGYSEDEAYSLRIADILHPDDRERVLNMLRQRLSGAPVPRNYMLRVLTKDGKTLHLDANVGLVVDDVGKVTRIQAFLRDVTDRAIAEEALRQSETRFRRLVERSTDAVSILDYRGVTTYQSPSSEAILGYAANDLVGQPLVSFIHSADKDLVANALEDLTKTSSGMVELGYRIHDRSGQVRWIESTFRNRLDDPSVAGIVVNSRNNTDRHRVDHVRSVQNNVLRLLIEGRPLSEVLSAVCAAVTSQIDGAAACVLMADSELNAESCDASPNDADAVRVLREHGVTLQRIANLTHENGGRSRQVVELPLQRRSSQRSRYHHSWSIPITSAGSRELWGALAILIDDQRGPEPEEAQVIAEAMSLAHLAMYRYRTEQERRENERLLRLVLDTLPVGVRVADADGRITMMNSADIGLRDAPSTDSQPEKVTGNAPSQRDLSTPEQGWGMSNAIRYGEATINREIDIPGEDGQPKTILHSAVPIRRPDGRIAGAVVVNHDISDRKVLEQRLIDQALHDGLTGLPNRKLLLDRLEHALDRSQRTGVPLAVIFFDLDNLKIVNDSLGHGLGDALIIEVGRRVNAGLRKSDTVARLGGDEFVILVEEVGDVAGALRVVKKIESILNKPIMLDGRSVQVTASLGIALSRDGGSLPEEIIRDADTAMYRAKRAGRAQHAVFDPEMHRETLRRLEIEQDLRVAIEQDGLRLHFQPQFRISSGRVIGLEALVRWQHDEKGLIPPHEFIGIAEETGLIVPLGRCVLLEACTQAKRWLDLGLLSHDVWISVNLSARQFREPTLIDDVIRSLTNSGLPARHLTLEMTESTIMDDPEQARSVLNRLHDLGVQLAIDDFGTGYSSLAHLTRFPFDFLKMDRTFIDALGERGSESVLISTMVQLGHAMSMQIIGEGIESAKQLEILRQLGCDIAQGFLLSPPLAPEQIPSLLDGPAGLEN